VTFLAPSHLLWLLGGLIILLLYMLRPRRDRRVVSSLWLWQEAVRETTSETPWQPLRRNLLMFLQLGVLAALALALARPFLPGEAQLTRHVVMVIDASPSMAARDVRPTRLDEAKTQALRMVQRLAPGQRASIVRMTDHAQVLALEEGDRDRLAAAIRSIQLDPPGVRRNDPSMARQAGALPLTNLRDTLSIAAALAQITPNGEIVVFTDAALSVSQEDLRLGAPVRFVATGGSEDNQAITTLAPRLTHDGSEWQVLLRVANFASAPRDVPIHIYVDGRFAETRTETVQGHSAIDLLLSNFPPATRLIEVRLWSGGRDIPPRTSPGGPDALSLDNYARADLRWSDVRKVLLVSERSGYLPKALTALPGVEIHYATPANYQRVGFDITIFDGWLPASPQLMPSGHWLIIDPPADNKLIPVEDTVSDVRGIRVEDSPLLRAVDLTGLVVSRMKKLQLPLWAQDVITSSSGPLLSVGRTEGRNVIIVAFDLRATNLVLRSAFPILVGNMIEWLSPRQSPAPSVAVDEREADITPRELPAPPRTEPRSAVVRVPAGTELWRWLALLALAIVTVEWWLYHSRRYRRVQQPEASAAFAPVDGKAEPAGEAVP
jgi:Ca-activated chloride channel family protein